MNVRGVTAGHVTNHSASSVKDLAADITLVDFVLFGVDVLDGLLDQLERRHRRLLVLPRDDRRHRRRRVETSFGATRLTGVQVVVQSFLPERVYA